MHELNKDRTNNMNNKPIIEIDNLHACISVANLDESIDWYQKVFGFKVFQRGEFPEFSTRIVYLGLKGVEIELVESSGSMTFRRPDPPIEHVMTQGISQLSFRVTNIEDVARRLKSHSIPIVFGPINADSLDLKAFFIRDNEGNLIEFIERSI